MSPGLAYTPFSEIVATLVTKELQRNVYSVVNSGTSLGVMLSGPAALLLGEHWRWAWALFAAFGLASTIWCVAILPRLPAREEPLSFAGLTLRSLLAGPRAWLFLVAFLLGISTSIYWAFSVDLVTAGGATYRIAGTEVPAMRFGQVFWTLVGLAGFAGMGAGTMVNRLGIVASMRLGLLGIAAATAMLALSRSPAAVLASGVIFEAFFVVVAAILGMWSLDLFADLPAVGFGLAFLLLSAGQFMGPMLVGLLIGRLDLGQLFLLSAGFSLALIAVLPRSRRVRRVAG